MKHPPLKTSHPPNQQVTPNDDIQRLERQIAEIRAELQRLWAEIDSIRPSWAASKPHRNDRF